ncbi:ABC transporter permease subunit [Carboxydochorda subterranea]|uniref:ABC transporter permease subunit n=1 Tax=Carboxydichorda subterranea TaxID=3109565 RepID=A0ABZ1BX55_9FIRM|nr:ABC transporter permease subunit [Limnochorda sp. L945t]WRP17357.1 ABC transporter permease subunit [Limnochorda sp. L945t]
MAITPSSTGSVSRGVPVPGGHPGTLPALAHGMLADARRRDALLATLGLVALLTLWEWAARQAGPALIPSPRTVAVRLWRETTAGPLLYHLEATTLRVLSATILGLVAGGAAGLWMGLSRRADAFFGPWLVTALAIPRLLIIVVAYLTVGLDETAAVLATAASVAPGVAAAMREAARALDRKLLDMATVFPVPRMARWRYVLLPQVMPYLAGSARVAVGLAFKMVLFAELLGRPSGVGYQIHFYFQMFNMQAILAYGVATVAVAQAAESLMRAAERRVFRWRPPAP